MSTFRAGDGTARHSPEVFEMQEIAGRAEECAPAPPAPTPSQQAHALLDTLFPRPAHAGNALHGVVPPVFRYDDRWPDAGAMPDLLGQCGALLGVAPACAAPRATDGCAQAAQDAATSPAVVAGTLDELHQVMPYLV